MTFSFYFRDPNAAKSLIMLALHKGGRRAAISTGLTDNPAGWDRRSQTMIKTPDAAYTNEMLARWKAAVNAVARDPAFDDAALARIKDAVLEKAGKKSSAGTGGQILPFYRAWAMTSTTKRVATRQMLYAYRTFANYAGPGKLSFDDITFAWCERYIEFLAEKGIAANTRGTHIKNLKTVMGEAYNAGLHANQDFKKFRKESEEVDSVYLTSDDLARLEALPLVGLKEATRDLFLIGCYTAMRWSDYSRLSKLDIEGGFIRQIQQKTRERVIIPLHPKVAQIVEKWAGAPKVNSIVFNRLIKDVCREAGLTGVVTIRRGGKEFKKEKWELVSSHTARRTAATNMYKSGIPAISIMKITGHRTEANFLRYIKISKEENAELLKNNPFFKD